MCNISKAADRRAKRAKIWDSGYSSAHISGTLDARFLEYDVWLFGAKFQFYNFLNSAPLPIFVRFIQTLYSFIQGTLIWGQYMLLLFGDLPKIKKYMTF